MLRWSHRAKRGLARWLEVYPRGTEVDPALFPESEYPVRCLDCGYALVGLPDGRCPECGSPFARGLLLVETYARVRLPRGDKRRRIARYLSWLSLALFLGGAVLAVLVPLGLMLVLKLAPEASTNLLMKTDFLSWLRFVPLLGAFGGVAWLGAMFLEIATWPPSKKRTAMREAAKRAAGWM